jgi:hypothetical protein
MEIYNGKERIKYLNKDELLHSLLLRKSTDKVIINADSKSILFCCNWLIYHKSNINIRKIQLSKNILLIKKQLGDSCFLFDEILNYLDKKDKSNANRLLKSYTFCCNIMQINILHHILNYLTIYCNDIS